MESVNRALALTSSMREAAAGSGVDGAALFSGAAVFLIATAMFRCKISLNGWNKQQQSKHKCP